MAFRNQPICTMTCDESHCRIGISMSDWNSRICWSRSSRGHSWNDPERNPCFHQVECFLTASAENKGVSPFESQYPFAASCELNDPEGNVRLLQRWFSSPFACVFQLALRLGEGQDFFIHQCIVNHHICLPQPVQGMQGQQSWISRTSAGEPDPARFELRKIKSTWKDFLQGLFVHPGYSWNDLHEAQLIEIVSRLPHTAETINVIRTFSIFIKCPSHPMRN